MKKYIFAAVLSLALLVSPAFTQAAALTSTQISAIVSLLQSFGADQTTINNVQASLNGGTPTTGGGTGAWCHTFNNDLMIGSTDKRASDVSALNQALSASGIDTTGNTTTFDKNTAADVVQFQAKYGIGQTGYVGPLTRAKLNALYGCSPNFPPTPTPFPPLPPQPSITVLSPNGWETFQEGSETTIKWNASNLPSDAKIQIALFQSDQSNMTIVSNLPATQREYVWKVNTTGRWGMGYEYKPSLLARIFGIRKAEAASGYKIMISASWGTGTTYGNVYDSSDASFSIVAGTVTTTTSAPTVEFIGTPTLGLQYDSAGKEAMLVGKATVKVTAENLPVNQQTQQNLPYILQFYRTGSGGIGNYGPTGSNSIRHTVAPKIVGIGCSGLPGGAILANTSCTFTITNMVPTKEIFAGAYTLSLSGFGYPDANGNWQTLQPSSFQNVSTNADGTITGITSQVIIGETSPYITSAGSDLAGNAIMTGVRFGNQGSNVATMIRLNGQTVNSGVNTNNGYYIVNYVDGVGYINIRPADFGITTSGYYQVQIINSSTGNSNLVTLNYTAPGITSTWSQASSGGSIARRLQYVSPTKIYGIGLDNAIWRWNGGSSWTSITQGSIKDDFVMVNGSESDIYAIGLDNQIWHWNGARWSQTSDGGKIQQKIWYVDGNHVYGIGMDNQVWRWGSAGGWVQITSNGQVKDDFHFISESDIYAFGLNDGVWHWDGSSWSPVSSGGSITLRLQYVSPTLMYGIGLDNKIWRWNGGSSWTQIAKSGQIKRDFVLVNNSENDIYAIGLDNQIWHLGPSTLSIKSGNFNPGLASVLGAFSGTNGATDSVSQSADKRTDNFTYVWNRDLQIGSPYSDDIIALQQALAREGVYAGEITGGFYNQTYIAARAFQEKYGINQTGYVGLLTRSKLNTLYSQ